MTEIKYTAFGRGSQLRHRAREAWERAREEAEKRRERERMREIANAVMALEAKVRSVLDMEIEIDPSRFRSVDEVSIEIDGMKFATRRHGEDSVLAVELMCDECFDFHWFPVRTLAHLFPLLTKLLQCTDALPEQTV